MKDLLHTLVYIIVNTFSFMDILLILQIFFGMKCCKRGWHYCVICGVFVVLNLIIDSYTYSLAYMAVLYLYLVLIVFISFQENKWKLLLFVTTAFSINLQWSSVISLFDTIFHLGKYKMSIREASVTPFNLCSSIMLFFILFLINRLVMEKERLQLNGKEAVFILLFCIFCPHIHKYMDDFMYSATWCSFILFLNSAIFYGIFYRKYAAGYLKLSNAYKQQFDMEQKYFNDYKKGQKDIVKFRHDWNNHLILLTSMFEKGEYDKAKTYFEELSAENRPKRGGILTGNEVVDMLLNAKQACMKQQNIELSCDGGLEQLKFMEAVDCCILFSNLIDNAIDANCQCDTERYIKIKASGNTELFIVELENRMNGQLKQEDDYLISTKNEPGIHGIGTQNAFDIIKKYGGDYRIITGKDRFTIRILFPFVA